MLFKTRPHLIKMLVIVIWIIAFLISLQIKKIFFQRKGSFIGSSSPIHYSMNWKYTFPDDKEVKGLKDNKQPCAINRTELGIVIA